MERHRRDTLKEHAQELLPNPSIERTSKQLRCLDAAHVKRQATPIPIAKSESA